MTVSTRHFLCDHLSTVAQMDQRLLKFANDGVLLLRRWRHCGPLVACGVLSGRAFGRLVCLLVFSASRLREGYQFLIYYFPGLLVRVGRTIRSVPCRSLGLVGRDGLQTATVLLVTGLRRVHWKSVRRNSEIASVRGRFLGMGLKVTRLVGL